MDTLEREVSDQERKLAHQWKPQKQKRIVEFLTEYMRNYPIFDRIALKDILSLTRHAASYLVCIGFCSRYNGIWTVHFTVSSIILKFSYRNLDSMMH